MKRDRFTITDVRGEEGTQWLKEYNQALMDNEKPVGTAALAWMKMSKKEKKKAIADHEKYMKGKD